MIEPLLKNNDFKADVIQAGKEADKLHLWWLGQSGFLIAWQGERVLLDPYLSDSLTKKYAGSDTPHERMTANVIEPAALDFIDVVTSSHNHTDHLDAETIKPLMTVNPKLTILVSEANREFAAEKLQVPPDRLSGIIQHTPMSIGAFTFHAIPAAHEALEFDEDGHPRYVGLVVQAGPWAIYHAGDTLRYPGMAAILRQWQIDIALLPINGHDLGKGVAGNLFGKDAVALGKDIGAGLVIPCHYDMFAFNTATPEAFINAAKEKDQSYRLLRCGERWSG